MATKTYADLTAATDILDDDLTASYRGPSGPLKSVAYSLLRTYVQATVPALTVSAKSANYTVLAADIGKTFNCSGTFTLALTAAATLATGFFFGIKNTGTGVITINPDSSELIDGRTTICVYPGEGFTVVCTATAFITEGRSSRVRLQGTYTVASAAAAVEFTQGWSDTEFREFAVDYWISGSTTATARLSVSGGGYGSNHFYSIAINTTNGVAPDVAAQTLQSFIQVYPSENLNGGRVVITPYSASTKVAVQITAALEQSAQSVTGGGTATLSSALDAIKFTYNTGNVAANSTFDIWGQR
jgi:hypothetical protein